MRVWLKKNEMQLLPEAAVLVGAEGLRSCRRKDPSPSLTELSGVPPEKDERIGVLRTVFSRTCKDQKPSRPALGERFRKKDNAKQDTDGNMRFSVLFQFHSGYRSAGGTYLDTATSGNLSSVVDFSGTTKES